jgi:hypothetical protein
MRKLALGKPQRKPTRVVLPPVHDRLEIDSNFTPVLRRLTLVLLPSEAARVTAKGIWRHFISDAITGLDLRAFRACHDKDGPRNRPFHPAMMVKVLIYES